MPTEVNDRIEERPEADEPPERPTWSRVVIIGAALSAVLLLGATLGMFLTRSLANGPAASPGAGSVEIGFAQDMSVHHLQAVTMANWARDHTSDPEIKQLAFDITSTQTEQVGRMKGWLMLWNSPEQTVGGYMTWMTEPMMGHDHADRPAAPSSSDAPMPGMATSAELATMRRLSGKALDVDFLQLMLRHHQGGTAMAHYARDHSTLDAVRVLTKSILDSQGAEINLMTQLLKARGAEPLPF